MCIFLLLGLGGPVRADWHYIGKAPEFTLYGDPGSLQRSGAYAKVWVMGDYPTAQSARFPPPLFWLSYQSVKELKEFDCAKRLQRTVRTAIFAAHLAKGDPLYTFDTTAPFVPVSNSPLDAAQLKFGCEEGKR
jgi:hypothetical protein